MDWENIHLGTRIRFLRLLLENSTLDGNMHFQTLNALITGSHNTYSGDMSFEFSNHHYKYLRNLWDDTIKHQKDNTVINNIKSAVNLSAKKD